jgi:hypothetical protein
VTSWSHSFESRNLPGSLVSVPHNGGTSGTTYWAAAVWRPTPQSIHRLRRYLLFSYRRLSAARLGDYSSGSQLLVGRLGPTITENPGLSSAPVVLAAGVRRASGVEARHMNDRIDISRYFERYGWHADEVESGAWRATFAAAGDVEFDLYVVLTDEWVHLAVSPFMPAPGPDARDRLLHILMQLNQGLQLVRFAVDADGDVNLVADLSRHRLAFAHFAGALDIMTDVTNRLSPDLLRTARDPSYRAPRLPNA